MMDEREDRLDALLRDAAREYNAPPVAPKAEIWERIQAARQAGGREVGKSGAQGAVPLRPEHRPMVRPPIRFAIAIAALLVLGVAIGRLTAPGAPAGSAASPTATGVAANPGGGDTNTPRAAGGVPRAGGTARTGRSELAARYATVQHLGQVESFLTEFNTLQAAQDFPAQAKDLLGTTRLLLDSKRLTDMRTRRLLEDLELVLIQIATLNPKDRREEDLIADGLAQSHLRTRLRSAIPTGSAIRM